jgi:hypothetical protein
MVGAVGFVYMAAALGVVPGLLIAFHLLSRTPGVTSQPPPNPSVADEAERWLRAQSQS